MIALVVYACLASQPDTCSQNVVRWSDQPAALSCSSEQPAPVTEWAAAHPDMIVKDHWCTRARVQTTRAAALNDGRALPLAACDVRSRSTAIVWSYRNPGVSAADECKRLMSQ